MPDVTPVDVLRVIAIAAPLLLALSIGTYVRIRRHFFSASEPTVAFRSFRWSSCLIATQALPSGCAAADSGIALRSTFSHPAME